MTTGCSPSTIAYDGVPETLPGTSGFMHTDDGALALGQPHGASYWYPVNDYPTDKASYEFNITVPEGLEAISNGRPPAPDDAGRHDDVDVGGARADGLVPGHDRDRRVRRRAPTAKTASGSGTRSIRGCTSRSRPRTGDQFALSQSADLAYKRLARTISVPAEGGELSFWVNRDTEPTWDFFFVEAHAVGSDDWTTLPDENGHTCQDTGHRLPVLARPAPVPRALPDGDGRGLRPEGTTGEWHAASGSSIGYEQWTIDLSRYAGQTSSCRSATRATTSSLSRASSSTTSRVRAARAPRRSRTTATRWTAGRCSGRRRAASRTRTTGSSGPPRTRRSRSAATIDDGLRAPAGGARLPRRASSGRYPFSTAGGVVDDADIGFALETQTRPVYSPGFFDEPRGRRSTWSCTSSRTSGSATTSRLARWQDIWLNEGFATYTEWLWSEAEGRGTAAGDLRVLHGRSSRPTTRSGRSSSAHPQSEDLLFDIAVYYRGAMTLHALRARSATRRSSPAAHVGGAGRRGRSRRRSSSRSRALDRAGSRRVLRDVAVHARASRRPRDRGRGPGPGAARAVLGAASPLAGRTLRK